MSGVSSLGVSFGQENFMSYVDKVTGNVTFRGLRIVKYSYNESQRDALFLKYI